MKWIKDVILDLVVLGLIITLVFVDYQPLFIGLWVYTGFLLVGKVLSLNMPTLQRTTNKTEAPVWVYHIIYLLSVTLLAYLHYFYLASAWIIVWVLSVILFRKMNQNNSTK